MKVIDIVLMMMIIIIIIIILFINNTNNDDLDKDGVRDEEKFSTTTLQKYAADPRRARVEGS